MHLSNGSRDHPSPPLSDVSITDGLSTLVDCMVKHSGEETFHCACASRTQRWFVISRCDSFPSSPLKASLKPLPWSQAQGRPIKAYVVKAYSGVGPVQWPYPPQEEAGENAGGGPGRGPAHRSVGPTPSCGQGARAKRRPPPRFKMAAAAPSAAFGRWGFRGPYFFSFLLCESGRPGQAPPT